jgi:hypothetical protein
MTDFNNDSLDALVRQYADRKPPPVSDWHPETTRESDIRIDSVGHWYYRGSRIERARMVALFSTILRLDGEDYYLVTPHEKLRVEVEDVPFVVQLMEVTGSGADQQLRFTDNTGNRFTAGSQNKLWIAHDDNESKPYCIVRDNLAALLARPVYYQLADLIVEVDSQNGVYSDGVFFPLE